MAHFHARSNSFPSNSHPVMVEIQDHLNRLKGSDVTSTSDKSAFSNLASLVNLQDVLKNLIQIPTIQQALSYNQFGTRINEILEGSVRLVDLCGFSREVVCLTKESVQDLEFSIRRNRGDTATANDIKTYLASRKKINKVVNKYITNLKSINQNSTALLEEDNALKTIVIVLKEMEAVSFSILKSVLLLLSGANERSKQRNWQFLSNSLKRQTMHIPRQMKNVAPRHLIIAPIQATLTLKFLCDERKEGYFLKLRVSEDISTLKRLVLVQWRQSLNLEHYI